MPPRIFHPVWTSGISSLRWWISWAIELWRRASPSKLAGHRWFDDMQETMCWCWFKHFMNVIWQYESYSYGLMMIDSYLLICFFFQVYWNLKSCSRSIVSAAGDFACCEASQDLRKRKKLLVTQLQVALWPLLRGCKLIEKTILA